MKTLFQNRALLTMAIAEMVSGLGSWVTTMAVFALVVFQGGGGVAQSSGIFLAMLLPMLFFSPIAGWLSDHLDRKWLLVGCELLSAAVVCGLIVTDSLPLIFTLLALQSCAAATFAPTRQAAVPAVVATHELTQANALLQQITGAVKIGGPVLAGAILAVISPHVAIVLDVISFLLSAAILSRLPSLRAVAAGGSADQPTSESPAPPAGAVGLGTLYAVGFMAVLAIMGFDIFSAVIVRDLLMGSEAIFGLLIGLIGLGSVLAGLWLMLRGGSGSLWTDMVLGLILIASLPAALALWIGVPSLARIITLATALIGGLGNGLLLIQSGTLVQTLAPAGRIGRVGATFQIAIVAGQLVALVVVPLLVPALVPIGLYLAWSALALVALAVIVALRTRPTGSGTLPVQA
ncbi:MAG: MFS transporter [Oscillochloris sp.]|nr:MFS transporter [Oscillochloris sp.]